jgi:DNA-binding NtrC family response regulator
MAAAAPSGHDVPSFGFPKMTISPAPVQGPAILLIDDDELIARSLRDYLVAKQLRVDVALDAEAADALMRQRQYATILVDPYLTGGVHSTSTTLVAAIRFLQPQSTIIVLTGYGSSTLLHAAAVDDATFLVFKPQSVPGLSELIHNIPPRIPSERSL